MQFLQFDNNTGAATPTLQRRHSNNMSAARPTVNYSAPARVNTRYYANNNSTLSRQYQQRLQEARKRLHGQSMHKQAYRRSECSSKYARHEQSADCIVSVTNVKCHSQLVSYVSMWKLK
jgi:hypothetical protein